MEWEAGQRHLAAQATECVDRILEGETGVAEAKLAEFNTLVAAMQSHDRSKEIYSTDPGIVDEFVIEAKEHIEAAESALLALENDPECRDSINAVFRAFHTIKGSSQFLNLKAIGELAHKAEILLVRVREGELMLVDRYADLALESVDMLKRMIAEVENDSECGPPQVPEDVKDLLARLDRPEFAGLARDEEVEIPSRLGDLLAASSDVAREEIERTAGEQGKDLLGEALVRSGKVTAAQVARALRTQRKLEERDRAEDTVRVSTRRLDKLVNMVGELVIANAMICQNPYIRSERDRSLTRKCSRLNKITRELQDLSISMRMVPLKGLFRKMARLVRDLARKSGKEIRFVAEGEETEIDRNMVESLSDPLVHMIRNACDHGIEKRDLRRSIGKSSYGTLILRAYHVAGSVHIELQDDGRGLELEDILDRAREAGLVEKGKDPSEGEICKFIFEPGFSTATSVTELSGRGVGMDVVRRNVEAMRGRVDVHSTPGVGTVFTIRIPLTLAIIDGMLVRVGAERYIIPTLTVKQALQLDEDSISTVQGRGEMIAFRDGMIPLFRLHRIFRIPDAGEDAADGIVLVLEHEEGFCGLLVDELLDQQQVVIKSLGRGLADVQGISGAAILGNGLVGLILDVPGIMALARSGAFRLDPQRVAGANEAQEA
jgi:two-component system chemotaxis sensor kinase CheA